MHRMVAAIVALTLFTASRANADVIPITSGFVFFDLDEFDFPAAIGGTLAGISGFVVGPAGFPCLNFGRPGTIVDVSATHRIGVGEDLFGFTGEARIDGVTSPNGDATLSFAAPPVRAGDFATSPFDFRETPFTMTGHLRVLADDGSVPTSGERSRGVERRPAMLHTTRPRPM
jgi:hypothetical protein